MILGSKSIHKNDKVFNLRWMNSIFQIAVIIDYSQGVLFKNFLWIKKIKKFRGVNIFRMILNMYKIKQNVFL